MSFNRSLQDLGSFAPEPNNPICGHSFETFVKEEIIKVLEATDVVNWDAYYYRTRAGA